MVKVKLRTVTEMRFSAWPKDVWASEVPNGFTKDQHAALIPEIHEVHMLNAA